MPWGLHERLWPIKYIIFLGLFGLSLYSVALAEVLAEVEPFKTAIILKFIRDWPFVIYALTLLAAGLFIERFFCRYLCPLGAALAIPGRMRMFEWLKRWPECGTPCQRCANECPVQSIHPEGIINVNECIYCMHCQELYHDDHRCPHMIQVRLKREKREALSSPVHAREQRRRPADPLNRSSPTRARRRNARGTDHGRRPDHSFMSEKEAPWPDKTTTNGLSRRQVLGTTAAAGAAGAGGRAGGVSPRRRGAITPRRRRDRRTGGRARRRQQVRGQAGRARRVLRLLLQRPDAARSASSACRRCAS